jgi:hypothetical protein
MESEGIVLAKKLVKVDRLSFASAARNAKVSVRQIYESFESDTKKLVSSVLDLPEQYRDSVIEQLNYSQSKEKQTQLIEKSILSLKVDELHVYCGNGQFKHFYSFPSIGKEMEISEESISSNQYHLLIKSYLHHFPFFRFQQMLMYMGNRSPNVGIFLVLNALKHLNTDMVKDFCFKILGIIRLQLTPAESIMLQKEAPLTIQGLITVSSIFKNSLGFNPISSYKQYSKLSFPDPPVYQEGKPVMLICPSTGEHKEIQWLRASLFDVVATDLRKRQALKRPPKGVDVGTYGICYYILVEADRGKKEMKALTCIYGDESDRQEPYPLGNYQGKDDYLMLKNTFLPYLSHEMSSLLTKDLLIVEFSNKFFAFTMVPKSLILQNCFLQRNSNYYSGIKIDGAIYPFDNYYQIERNISILRCYTINIFVEYISDLDNYLTIQGRKGHSGTKCFRCMKTATEWKKEKSYGPDWTLEQMDLYVRKYLANEVDTDTTKVEIYESDNDDEDKSDDDEDKSDDDEDKSDDDEDKSDGANDDAEEEDEELEMVLSDETFNSYGFKRDYCIFRFPVIHWALPVLHMLMGLALDLLKSLFNLIEDMAEKETNLMRQIREKIGTKNSELATVLKEHQEIKNKRNVQDKRADLVSQIRTLKKELKEHQKALAEAKSIRPRPVKRLAEDVLKDFGIALQAYHAQALNGGHSWILLTSHQKILSRIHVAVSQYISPDNCNLLNTKIKDLKFLFSILYEIFIFVKRCENVNDIELKFIEILCNLFGKSWRDYFEGRRFPPKLHLLESHLCDEFRRKRNLARTNEQAIERLHYVEGKNDHIFSSNNNWKERKQAIYNFYYKMQITEVKEENERYRRNRRRKFSPEKEERRREVGLMRAEEQATIHYNSLRKIFDTLT